MIVPIILLFCINYSFSKEAGYCFANVKNPYYGFATKTPYRFISNGKIEKPQMPTDCEPLQIWMFARHATRYPQEEAIQRLKALPEIRDRIIESHSKKGGTGHLCDEDLKNLERWMPLPNATLFTANIATEGWKEGHELGQIYRNAFPSLLTPAIEDINSQNYVFNSKRRRRAEYSMYAFMEGLFGSSRLVKPAPAAKAAYVLKPDKNCPLWANSVDFDEESERDRFIMGPDYAEMRANVSRRLGFDASPEDIHNMQDMCRFEMAWIRNYTSPWCGVFNEDEWKVMEYIDDLQYYYYAAHYALEVNGLLSCFVLQDLLDHFQAIETGDTTGQPKGIFYFSNSKVLLGLLSALGMAKDTSILRSFNYKQLINRQWKTTFLSPFFANFAATFYRCNKVNTSYVTFHFEERLVKLEGCQDGICEWDYLKMKFSKPPGQCIKDCAYENNNMTLGDCFNGLIIMIFALIVGAIFRRFFFNAVHKITRWIKTKMESRKSSGVNFI